jgi:hypothetical protein
VQAREALAFAKLNAGDLKGARSDFVCLSQSLDAGQGVQARAKAAIGLIDAGSAKAVPAVVKAAATLPPPMPIDPSALMPAAPRQANRKRPPRNEPQDHDPRRPDGGGAGGERLLDGRQAQSLRQEGEGASRDWPARASASRSSLRTRCWRRPRP